MSTLVVDTLRTNDGSTSVDVNKIPQFINAEYFGVKFDGVTDNTASLQLALNEGRKILLPEGVGITGPLTFMPGSGFIGRGIGKTTLKAATENQVRIITITGSGCSVDGISLVGKGNTIYGDWRNGLLSVVNATDFEIRNIQINTAPNLGAMFYNCSKGVKRGVVENLTVINTGWKGIVVFSPCSSIDFFNIEQSASAGNHGFSFDPYIWSTPIATGSVSDIHINGLFAHDNTNGFGLFTFGLFAGGTSYDDFYYTFTEQMVSNSTFQNIRLDKNVSGAILGGSRCNYHNIEASGNGGSGMVINGYKCNYNLINSFGNAVYGIDMGGATYCNVTNINLSGNNPVGDFCIALNVGGCVGCVVDGGVIAGNGINNSNCTAIVLTGKEGDGTYAYTQNGGFNRITNLFLQGSSNQYAIRAWRGDACSVIENITMSGFTTTTAVQDRTINTNTPVTIRNITVPAVNYSNGVVLASASTLLVPDHAEFAYITGSTSITSIKTQTQNDFTGKVNDVLVTNVGSGYSLSDTVSFSGDGSGATGTLDIGRGTGGAIVSVIVNNPGSGYTSSSVSVTSSTGSGFSGNVIIGSVNCKERVLTIFFESALTINVAGMNSSFVAQAGSTLTLKRMQNGSWAEISRAY
ncbi:hypothetical protein M2403_002052 [Rahnella sp. BIGb0603]|uniref:glycoside hydrolase family 55 protein n=1 Tax=Rahnella sp. BIGb0603 TaxID=2940612 RepID=UPI002166E6A2|nr:glycoside hydrolase family 55 protein [Rahnella sp. BIGb0603]MCS3423451.1 hypothetical protein [Rahnella sp. BIGb0603]